MTRFQATRLLLTIEDVIFAGNLPAMDVPDVEPSALTRLIKWMVTPDGDKRPQLDTVHTHLLDLKFVTPETCSAVRV